MKRLLPLLMLTGLLFGQNMLHLKSGELYTGTFYGKVGKDIVFMVEGETSTKKFSINDVEIIKIKSGELSYPFDVPKIANDAKKNSLTLEEEEYQKLSTKEKAIYDANLYDLKDWVNREEIFYFHKSIQYMTASEKEIYMQAYSKRLKGRKINHIVGCTIVTGAGCWLLAGLLMESFYRAW